MKKYLFNKFLVIFTFLYGFHCSSTNPLNEDSKKEKIVQIASPAYDFSFKELFGNLNILKGFLNSLYYPNAKLKNEKDVMIRDIKIRSPYSVKEGDLKDIYFDVACRCYVYANSNSKDQYIFNVEMQRKVRPDYFNRSIFYGARILSDELKKGDEYKKLIPIRVISFLNENLDNNEDRIFHVVMCKKSRNNDLKEIDNPILKFTYIQLEKFIPAKEDMNNKLNQWISLMNIEHINKKSKTNNKYLYSIDKAKYTDHYVKKAIKKLKKIGEDSFKEYKSDVKKTKKLEALIESRLKESITKLDLERQKVSKLKEKFKKLKRKYKEVIQESEEDSRKLKMARKEDQLENDLIDPE